MHRTKRKIFEKSMELFASKGYDRTSIEEITSVVGIAKGTLYHHFSNKEEILKFLIEEGMKLLKNNIEIKTANLESSIEKIKAIILIQIKVSLKYEDFIALILSQLWGKEKRNEACRNCIIEYTDIIERIVKEGIEKKEIQKGDTGAIAYGIFTVITSSMIYKQNKNKDVDARKLYNEFCRYIIDGLRKNKNKSNDKDKNET